MSGDESSGGRPYRPPVGFPAGAERRDWRAAATSLAVHAALLVLLLIPAVAAVIVHLDPRAAGWVGGARGGGGGNGGQFIERLHFLEIMPPATPPAAKVPTPVPRPIPVAPPEPPKAAAVEPRPDSTPSLAHGEGGAGEGGAGPGTGGGRGTGTGTGEGAGRGPGTGGDAGSKIKATADMLTVYTVDPPKHPRPFHMVAVFEVAESGAARLLSVTKSDDGDFDRKMREHLLETHFHPATRLDGTPVRDTVAITGDY